MKSQKDSIDFWLNIPYYEHKRVIYAVRASFQLLIVRRKGNFIEVFSS